MPSLKELKAEFKNNLAEGSLPQDLKEKLRTLSKCDISIVDLGTPLEQLIEDYKTTWWDRVEASLLMLDNPLEYIVGDCNKENKIGHPPYNRNFHQKKVLNASIKLIYDAIKPEIKRLRECNDFNSLYQEVCKIIIELRKDKKCPERGLQFGMLGCYDLALRIGYHEMRVNGGNRNLYPQDLYLHAGVMKGAQALWTNNNLDMDLLRPRFDKKLIEDKKNDFLKYPIRISMEELQNLDRFPKALFSLSPSDVSQEEHDLKYFIHLENIICIYHLQLKSLAGTITNKEKEKFYKKYNKK